MTRGLDALPEPQPQELAALNRIKAAAGTRLACQIRPTADISILPLFAADAAAADGAVRGGLEGSERPITVVFVDLRGSTTIGEARLPYDVLYLLNRFFNEMTRALHATNGHYSQFTGDGLMALYGLYDFDPKQGAADALRGAREMLIGLDQLNRQLRNELAQPLRIGIGIHHSEAIVGTMGPPRSQIITAIGDTVNTCARLESLTKEFNVPVVVSRQAAETGRTRHQRPQSARGSGQGTRRQGRVLRPGNGAGPAALKVQGDELWRPVDDDRPEIGGKPRHRLRTAVKPADCSR